MAGHTTEGSLGAIRGARREVRRNRGLAILSAVLALTVSLPLAQSNPLYIPFSPSDVKGVLYKPDARDDFGSSCRSYLRRLDVLPLHQPGLAEIPLFSLQR